MKIRTAILLTAITLFAVGGCQETPEPIADPAPAPAEQPAVPIQAQQPDADSDESTEPSSGDTNQ